ncbi:MAG: hypothetical protein WB020_06555, partial [Candidatus Dormiibacterota bacterium]
MAVLEGPHRCGEWPVRGWWDVSISRNHTVIAVVGLGGKFFVQLGIDAEPKWTSDRLPGRAGWG